VERHPLDAQAGRSQAVARWLDEFPSLAQSDLGRTFREFRQLAPEWQDASVTRLRDFYESELFKHLGPQFNARLEQLARTWRGQ